MPRILAVLVCLVFAALISFHPDTSQNRQIVGRARARASQKNKFFSTAGSKRRQIPLDGTPMTAHHIRVNEDTVGGTSPIFLQQTEDPMGRLFFLEASLPRRANSADSNWPIGRQPLTRQFFVLIFLTDGTVFIVLLSRTVFCRSSMNVRLNVGRTIGICRASYGSPLKIRGRDLVEGSNSVEVTDGHLRIVIGDPAYGGWTWSYKGPWYRGWSTWWGEWGDHRYAKSWYQKFTRVIDPAFHMLRLNALRIERVGLPENNPGYFSGISLTVMITLT